jgi:hypothetical protein
MMRWGCMAHGHVDKLNPEPGRLSVACAVCGRESAGIEIPAPRYRRTQEGRANAVKVKRRLGRCYLAWRLHEAA